MEKEKKENEIDLPEVFTAGQIKTIQLKTPKEVVKYRKGRGGKEFAYVETNWVNKRLNEIFGFGWDFEILEQTPEELAMKIGQILIKGKLTVKDINGNFIAKTQFGSAEVKWLKDKPHDADGLVNLPDDYKAGASDCLKKTASMLGIALDVYSGDFSNKKKDGKETVKGEEHKESPATTNQKQYVADLIRTLYPLQSQQDNVMGDEIGKVKPIEDLTYIEAHDLITRLKWDKEARVRKDKKEEEKGIEEDEPFVPKGKIDPQAQMRAIDATIKNLGIPPEKFREKLIQIYKTEKVGELSFDQKADVIRDLNSGVFLKR